MNPRSVYQRGIRLVPSVNLTRQIITKRVLFLQAMYSALSGMRMTDLNEPIETIYKNI